jgi:Arc/MetJ family transcription regulator
MTKRLVEIDDTLLEQAQAVTGAPTIRATVDAALRRVVGDEAVRRHVAWLRNTDGLDLDVLADVRAPRYPEGA